MNLAPDLTDRHVVITGASGGLGAAVVEQLLAAGALVHAPLMEAAVPAAATWLERRGVDARAGVDGGDEAAITAYFASLPPVWASIHLVGGYVSAALIDTRLADFERMMALNARTCFLATREAARAMRGRGGRIVNVAARPALVPTAGLVAYAAAKAAVVAITQGAAAELTADGVFVNAIVPSIIDTPANRAAMPDADVSRWPKPAELAAAIAYLASPANALTSGALVPVYGRA
jgi:NAD(P)-dependent dehydrogenase (short-subunit alcohol dehydrogenase family)